MSKEKNKNDPVPIRFDDYEDGLLRELSKKTSLPMAQIVRFAVKAFLREVERTNSLPLEMEWPASSKPGPLDFRRAAEAGGRSVKKPTT